jgi:hypothetical protein
MRSPAAFALAFFALLAIITSGLFAGVQAAQAKNARPTPMPSAKACGYFKDLHPASTRTFDSFKLSAKQRRFILAQVKTIPAGDRRYARWMFDQDVDSGIDVFDAFPVYPDDNIGSHAAWVATNTNVGLDPIECRMFITPTAQAGRSALRTAEYR